MLGAFLVIFAAGGFGFVGGIVTSFDSYWGKIFYSFYFLDLLAINSLLPAFAVLSAGLFCLLRYFEIRRLPWLILSGFLLAGLAEYKITFAAPLLGGLTLMALLFFFFRREKGPLLVWLTTLLMWIPLFLLSLWMNRAGLPYSPKLDFNDWFVFPLVDLGLESLKVPWMALVSGSSFSPVHLILAVPVVLIFFIGAYGFGTMSLPGMAVDFLRIRRTPPFRWFLIAIFLMGLGYFVFVSPQMAGVQRNFTNIYIFYLTVFIVILFFARGFSRFLQSFRSSAWKVIFLCGLILFSLPNAAQFMWIKVHYPQPRVFSGAFLETCEWLNEFTPSAAVILHQPELKYVPYFSDRRVVLDQSGHSYLDFHLTESSLRERRQDIRRFFNDPVLSGDVIRKYNVDFVLVFKGWEYTGTPASGVLECFTPLGGQSIKKYRSSYFLEFVYENSEYSLFGVKPSQRPESGVFVLVEEGGSREMRSFQDIYKIP